MSKTKLFFVSVILIGSIGSLSVCLSVCMSRCLYICFCLCILPLYVWLYVCPLLSPCVASPPGRRVHTPGSTGASPCLPGGPHIESSGAPRWTDASFPVSERAAGSDSPAKVRRQEVKRLGVCVKNRKRFKKPTLSKRAEIMEYINLSLLSASLFACFKMLNYFLFTCFISQLLVNG